MDYPIQASVDRCLFLLVTMEIKNRHREILNHLAGGGQIAVRIYGKTTSTMDTVTSKRSFAVGIKAISDLEDAGLVCKGDPTTYKTGKSYPYLLTESGSKASI